MWNQVICKLTEKKFYRQILIISPKNQIYQNPFIWPKNFSVKSGGSNTVFAQKAMYS